MNYLSSKTGCNRDVRINCDVRINRDVKIKHDVPINCHISVMYFSFQRR